MATGLVLIAISVGILIVLFGIAEEQDYRRKLRKLGWYK